MKTTITPTARNSDCQFCSVFSQKSGSRRYLPQETVDSACSALLVVEHAPVVERLGEPGREEHEPHREQQRVLVDAPPEAAHGCPARRSSGGVRPDLLLLVRLEAGVLEPLRLVRALLDEPDGRSDEDRELQELRLPVLHHSAPELDEVTYSHQDTGAPPCSRCSALEARCPANDWAVSETTKNVAKKTDRPFSLRNVFIRRRARRRPRGRRRRRSRGRRARRRLSCGHRSRRPVRRNGCGQGAIAALRTFGNDAAASMRRPRSASRWTRTSSSRRISSSSVTRAEATSPPTASRLGEDGGDTSLRVELELEAVRVVGAEADRVREHANRPEAQQHDRRGDDPEAVLARADRRPRPRRRPTARQPS